MRLHYRLVQFWKACTAPWRVVDRAYVEKRLAPPLLMLFQQMPHAEQIHAIEVCRRVEASGYDDPDLLAAALLHDVGKVRAYPTPLERAVVVIVEHFAPRLAAYFAESEQRWWRAFRVRRHHPCWGAEMVARVGGSARTVELIRHHHQPHQDDDDELLSALRAADEGT